MALPINTSPTYSLIVPSTGKEVKFRSFLIKEEKALLIAQQSDNPKVMMDTLKGVIKSCTFNAIDVESLAMFDLEYIFTQLRAISVGEDVELFLKCDVCEDEKAVTPIRLDLTQLKVETPVGHSTNINLFDGVGVIMKYPSLDTITKLEIGQDSIDGMFDIVVDCIDSIYTAEEIYHAKEQTREDLMDFLNNLTSEQFAKIQSFFETMPKLKKELNYKCPVCGKEHNKVLEGISSFF